MKIVFPSKWVKADDIGDEMIVTIEKVGFDESDDKGITYWIKFKEFSDKKWTLNVTNFKTISKVMGSEDSDDWIGEQITLYTTEVTYGGETMMGIRVRLKKPGEAKKQPPLKFNPLGEEGEKRLTARLDREKQTLGALRTHLAGKFPDMEAVIAGEPRDWPGSLKQEIADWFDEVTTPF